MSDTRICKKCGIEKPLSEYWISNGFPRTFCKYCGSIRKNPIKPDGSVINCKSGQQYIKVYGKWEYVLNPKIYYLDDEEKILNDIEIVNSLYEDEFRPIVRYRKQIPGYFVSKKGEVVSTRGKIPIKIKIVENKPMGVSNSKRKILSTSFKVGLPSDFFGDYIYKTTCTNASKSSVRISTHRAVMETWKPIDEYPPDSLKDDWNRSPESFKQWVRDTAFIDHLDDNPTNNHIDNLRWVTPLQNHYRRKKVEYKSK
jgi:hypothetical protein